MGASSKVIDWAEQQSSQSSGPTTQPSYETYIPTRFQAEQSRTITRPRAKMARVYSIASLLRIGQLKTPVHIELRINPAALTENIFKTASSSVPARHQENLRPQGQARSSNFTGESTNSGEDGLYDGTFLRPFRQPLNPPEATLIQKHAGFARFLKQHASPPHHRVTAGGRIVPAGPLSPPPFQLLPSINAVVTNPHSRSLAGKNQASLPETSIKGSNNPKTPSGTPATPLAQQNVNANRTRPFNNSHPASVINNMGTTSAAQTQVPLINQFGTNLGPLPPGATPIGFLPDGSPLVYFNGVNYQSYWDGTSTILKPLQLSVPQMGYNAPSYPPVTFGPQFYGFQGPSGLGYPQEEIRPLQFTDGISDAREQSQQVNTTSSQDIFFLHNQMSSQLTTLDKYVALHLHELSPAENARCTAMRRQLVEQLDNLRTSKGNAGAFNPTDGTMYGAYAAASWSAKNGATGATNLPSGVPSIDNNRPIQPTTPGTFNGQSVPPPKGSKCLSPDAPPFVPGANVSLTDRADAKSRTLPSGAHKPVPHYETGYLNEDKDRATNRPQGHADKPDQGPQKAQKVSSKSITTSTRPFGTVIRSSNDFGTADLQPQVSMSEIEYASMPGFNPPEGPKVYCTAVNEFQEVIRRVRQQAQMYGCKGGQSKDPAYDAEQDIRWAMADGEPIPLPRSPADHLRRPRPWSWDDSAFNCRREAATSPLRTSDILGHGILEHSIDSTGSASHSRADSLVSNSQLGDFDKHYSSKTTTGESAARLNDPSSSLRVRKQSSSHNQTGTNRSISQPYAQHIGQKLDRTASSTAGFEATWGVNNGELNRLVSQLKVASPSDSVGPKGIVNSASDDHPKQYHANLKEAPKTPTKPSGHFAHPAASPGLNERSQGTQQLLPLPNQATAHPERRSAYDGTNFRTMFNNSAEQDHSQTAEDYQEVVYHQRRQSSQPHQHMLSEGVPLSNFPDAENDALSFDSQGIAYSEIYDTGTFARSKPKAAKVNLPPARGHPASTEAAQAPEEHHMRDLGAVQFVKIPSDDTSQGFLRGLLKSPRYSAVRTHKSEPFDLMQYYVDSNERSEQEAAKRLANKENVKSDDYHDTISGYGRRLGKAIKDPSNPRQSPLQDILAHKARSSLAASSYQAVGRLPQYDGAGDALVSSNRQGEGATSGVGRSTTNDSKASGGPDSDKATSRREQAKLYDVGATDEYDYRGLTRKHFTVAPDRPSDLRAHQQYVDRFLDRIREEELQEVAATHGRDPVVHRRL
ncbi:MAG: hypothetical protein Q9213_006373 [Squamulea squamosa]